MLYTHCHNVCTRGEIIHNFVHRNRINEIFIGEGYVKYMLHNYIWFDKNMKNVIIIMGFYVYMFQCFYVHFYSLTNKRNSRDHEKGCPKVVKSNKNCEKKEI